MTTTTEAAVPETPETQAPRRCPATKSDGTACDVGADLLMPSGWCFAHDPATRLDHKKAATLGGIAQSRTRRKGLDPDELGKLETPADAQRITARLALALASAELPAPAGRAALVAVQQWLRAYEAEQADRETAAIEEQNRLMRGRT